MRTIRLPRALAAVATLVAIAACSESLGPSPTRATPANITVAPRNATIRTGDVLALTAQVFDEFGDQMVGVTYTWSSSDESVATVSPSGTVYGQGEGRAAITARAHGKAQSSSVQVVRGEGGKPQPSGPIL